jgi:DNA-binding SARP family transcriptional activator
MLLPAPPQRRGGTVEVLCFGGFSISVDGHLIDLNRLRPRARTLLRRLILVHGHDVHREQLANELWPGAAAASAHRSLQVAVSSVRRALESVGLSGQRVLRRSGDAYRLDLPSHSHVDFEALDSSFRAAVRARAAGDLSGAVHIRAEGLTWYRGELLPEDGPAEWVVAERDRLRVTVVAAGLDQAKDLASLGDADGAIQAVTSAIRLDRYFDPGWDLLEELHAEAGNAAEALRVRRTHERIVAELEQAPAELAQQLPVSQRSRVPRGAGAPA